MAKFNEDEIVYLKSHVKIEPLFYRWYAWSHLIAPVQQALNLAFRMLPMLKSFAANPAVHVAASKNPQLLGGPFLELRQTDLPAVRTLMQGIMVSASPLLTFANDLMKLDRHLNESEHGHSLDHFYKGLPESLSGLVEVAYDLNSHPTIRTFEELLIHADDGATARFEIALSEQRDEARNFFLNTPRIDPERYVFLPADFQGGLFDTISKARLSGVPYREWRDSLGITDGQVDSIDALLTRGPGPREASNYNGDGVRLRYFGHACVLIQSKTTSIVVDPFVTWDEVVGEARLTFADLPDHIDYAFITHNHQDHFSPELLLQLRGRIGSFLVPNNNATNFADPSMKTTLHALGFENVRVLDALDKLAFADGEIVALPFYGEHADLNVASKQGMLLNLCGRRFLFLADSDCKDRMLYRRIVASTGPVDTLFIGMECDGAPLSWLYGPYLNQPISRNDDNSRRLNGSDCNHAWAIVEEFDCKTAYVYAMGQEPWMRFVTGLEYTPDSKQIVESDRFIARCREAGVRAERLMGSQTMDF